MSTSGEVNQHFAVFENLVTKADNYLRVGNYPAAAASAQVAAAYATHHHPGLFVSYRLEDILLAIGRKTANKTHFTQKDARSHPAPRHVLHVITEALVVGGLTRMVWRWIRQDTDSRHSVALTRQHEKIPQALKDAVNASGGSLYRLNDKFGSILTWSQDLRRIAASADVVVLHIYPYDVIPLIAFADKRSMPPIILLNQSDHKFWLGASISDVVANQRYSGFRHAQTRRGIDQSRCSFLPIVLPPITRTFSIAEAKAQIGLSPDAVLLLSIARHSKFVPLSGYGSKFNDLVLPDSILPVLEQYPNSALIAIGPYSSDRWEQASQIMPGRVVRLGEREDTAIYYQAADIYLDSFPFSSITSCLEAGSYALPVVSCDPYSEVSDVLGADTPALDNSILRVKNRSEFILTLSHLIEDPNYRTCIGEVTQENILSVHMGEHWERYLRDLYLQAENTPATTPTDHGEDHKMISELDILSLDIDKLRIGEQMVTRDHMRLYPIDKRINLWLKIIKEQHVFKPSLLLSEWLAVHLKSARSSMLRKST